MRRGWGALIAFVWAWGMGPGAITAALAQTKFVAPMLASADVPVPAVSPLSIDLAQAKAAVRTEADVRGLDPRLVARLLDDMTADPSVIAAAGAQPEHERSASEYVSSVVSLERITAGLVKKAEQSGPLMAIGRMYGVDPAIVLAIWGIESNYGNLAGDRPIIRSLLTLAAADDHRAAYWRSELVAAIGLVARGAVRRDDLVGSWAGALGHTQFMPSTWAKYGVDFDHDGHANPFGNPVDALASTANYLRASGWRSGEPWGFEVVLPGRFDYGLCAPGNARPLQAWVAMGVQLPSNASWPRTRVPLQLRLPSGAGGPAFLTTPNFSAILAYNASLSYALAVGLLADRIGGRPGLSADWPQTDVGLTRVEREELQVRLASLGHSTGAVDGVLGELTRTAIRAYQRSRGLAEDGYPGATLLNVLRRENNQ